MSETLRHSIWLPKTVISGACVVVGGATIIYALFTRRSSAPPSAPDDRVQVMLPFVKDGYSSVHFGGLPTLSWNLWQPITAAYTLVFGLLLRVQKKPVTMLDARTARLDYNHCGFELLPVAHTVADWDDLAEIEAFKLEVELRLKQLHPGVRRFVWTDLLKRGTANNPPALNGPHLDHFQDRKQAQEFVGCGVGHYKAKGTTEAPGVDFEAYGAAAIVVGVWKPVMMRNPVLDYPLCVLDASTFREQDQVRFEQHCVYDVNAMGANGHSTPKSNLAAHLRHHKAQKWYYYPRMTIGECLLFRHYTDDQFLCNVHCAFEHGKLPAGADTRTSLESRVALIFS